MKATPARLRGHDTERLGLIVSLVNEGVPVSAIARHLDLTPGRVYQRLRGLAGEDVELIAPTDELVESTKAAIAAEMASYYAAEAVRNGAGKLAAYTIFARLTLDLMAWFPLVQVEERLRALATEPFYGSTSPPAEVPTPVN